ncbi:hypothetical protein FCV25MIE_12737 [Fagus crenata]
MQQLYTIKLLLLRNEVMYNGERSLLFLHNKYVLFHESFLVDQIQFRNHQKQKWAYQAAKTTMRVVPKALLGAMPVLSCWGGQRGCGSDLVRVWSSFEEGY